MANHFHILPVPREPLALDDYRWDLLGQGIGPEHLVVDQLPKFVTDNSFDGRPNGEISDYDTTAKLSKFAGDVSIRKSGMMGGSSRSSPLMDSR